MTPEQWEAARIALGAFLTSPGFGGLSAAGAALIAYRGIKTRIGADRALAREADERQRWWEALIWLSEHRTGLPRKSIIEAVNGLADSASTREQLLMLKAVREVMLPPFGPEERRE